MGESQELGDELADHRSRDQVCLRTNNCNGCAQPMGSTTKPLEVYPNKRIHASRQLPRFGGGAGQDVAGDGRLHVG